MTYHDKYGTEIRDGDKLHGSDGIYWTIIDRKQYLPEQLVGDVVLSRADGTPVYRYKGGEDVRVGDEYEDEEGVTRTLCHVAYDLWARQIRKSGYESDIANHWRGYTLIRRAEESEPSSRALIAQRPELAAHACACGRRSLLCDARGRCPDCQKRPLSDAERDFRATCHECGSDIPLGSTTVQTSVITAHGTTLCNDCASKHATFQVMKSVGTTEKFRHFRSIEEMNAAYGWNMKAPPPMQVFGIDWAGDALAEQIESACRALSRPTLADRFAAFKSRVTELLSDKRVTFVFDCDAANGPVVKVWCDALPAYEWVGFTEQATNEQIIAHLNGWAKRIGQEYLRGNVVVGKK